jgi:hypothetical protein
LLEIEFAIDRRRKETRDLRIVDLFESGRLPLRRAALARDPRIDPFAKVVGLNEV